jgi:hypothetical protein
MPYSSSPDRVAQLIFGIATLSPTEISDFQEALLTCIIRNRAFNRHRNGKYLETTPAATHTNTPTVWLPSVNNQYSGVSESMGFHVSEVLLSSCNIWWTPGTWIVCHLSMLLIGRMVNFSPYIYIWESEFHR